MDIVSVDIRGFKRFEEKSSLDLNQKLVALIGPNEAGKSSVLDALLHTNINNTKPFSRFELTRDVELDDSSPIVKAKYYLEEEDHKAIDHIYNSEELISLSTSKYSSGNIKYTLNPWPKKNPLYREQLFKSLDKIVKSKWLNDFDDQFRSTINECYSILDKTGSKLTESQLKPFKDLLKIVYKKDLQDYPNYISKITSRLENFTENQDKDESILIYNILKSRIPKIIQFGSEDRFLKPSYNLKNEEEKKSKALKNLCNVSSLNLNRLLNAQQNKDQALVRTLITRANEKLDENFSQFWSQAKIYVRFNLNNTTLDIHIQDEENVFSAINERSDGLRQYVSLMAFACSNPDQKRIILIDEAEVHLHYDAQADLIQMLTKQTLAEKVIYTTHSAGCLPEDLGHGVRLINPISDSRSKVQNWFWSNNQPGFSSLLFGMGAQTLAFVPMRKAIFVEGATDMLLLPTLLRQANQKKVLGFQVAPGIVNSSTERIKLLDNEASNVKFLIDNDSGGEKLKRQLLKANIDKKRILKLVDGRSQRTVIEDLLNIKVYVKAINNIISEFTEKRITNKDLGHSNRPKKLETWCKKNRVQKPGKREVSIAVLNLFAENPRLVLHDKNAQGILINLFNKIDFSVNQN